MRGTCAPSRELASLPASKHGTSRRARGGRAPNRPWLQTREGLLACVLMPSLHSRRRPRQCAACPLVPLRAALQCRKTGELACQQKSAECATESGSDAPFGGRILYLPPFGVDFSHLCWHARTIELTWRGCNPRTKACVHACMHVCMHYSTHLGMCLIVWSDRERPL
jgi:hypothetical protein